MKVLNSEETTSSLLEKVLNGDSHAAELLAEAVHSELDLTVVNTRKDIPDDPAPSDDFNIWIDPIGKQKLKLICLYDISELF